LIAIEIDLQLLRPGHVALEERQHGDGGEGGGDVLMVVVVLAVKSSLWWWLCECGACLWSYRRGVCFPSLCGVGQKVKATCEMRAGLVNVTDGPSA
jgi:hypothetical protein